ncbi:DUF3037 domain-containing protein [Pseudanabaena sp. ABRG5-3]|uniref:DUF3037 domain-containing protein n=1 Tax=Pseudanabaena sp. ABRG5-3 TaxID=685565 RepID=UPI000DC721DF|nr:DUF3037 domain-containing protein [Pseudanabaena sp. ABRG5-3]BBC24870.1 hypothetical protein ABRG53_2613 [Pseudanabaena sp. ABRG5-3]
MASRYSVIQYVPNPIADERINIGVLVFDEKIVKVHFLRSWERVKCFGKEDIKFLRDFADRMKRASKKGLLFPNDDPNNEQSRVDRLRKVSRGWINSIQFTEPRGSLENVDSLFEDTINTYLVDEIPTEQNVRDRQSAKRIVTSSVKNRLKKRFGKEDADKLFKKDGSAIIKGVSDSHNFDVAVANGHPYLAAHGVSFEIRTHKETLDALSWWIKDVKELDSSFPLAIVALPPKPEFPDYSRLFDTYNHTKETYTNLGASVLGEEDLPDWTDHILEKVDIGLILSTSTK